MRKRRLFAAAMIAATAVTVGAVSLAPVDQTAVASASAGPVDTTVPVTEGTGGLDPMTCFYYPGLWFCPSGGVGCDPLVPCWGGIDRPPPDPGPWPGPGPTTTAPPQTTTTAPPQTTTTTAPPGPGEDPDPEPDPEARRFVCRAYFIGLGPGTDPLIIEQDGDPGSTSVCGSPGSAARAALQERLRTVRDNPPSMGSATVKRCGTVHPAGDGDTAVIVYDARVDENGVPNEVTNYVVGRCERQPTGNRLDAPYTCPSAEPPCFPEREANVTVLVRCVFEVQQSVMRLLGGCAPEGTLADLFVSVEAERVRANPPTGVTQCGSITKDTVGVTFSAILDADGQPADVAEFINADCWRGAHSTERGNLHYICNGSTLGSQVNLPQCLAVQ